MFRQRIALVHNPDSYEAVQYANHVILAVVRPLVQAALPLVTGDALFHPDNATHMSRDEILTA